MSNQNTKTTFDYMSIREADQYQFYMLPVALIKEDTFSGLSLSAKLLYSLMLHRAKLSRRNNWVDKDGHIYIIYTINEITADMNIHRNSATKILQELDDVKGIGLIKRIRQGLGKPDIIYVKDFASGISVPEHNYAKNEAVYTEEEQNFYMQETHHTASEDSTEFNQDAENKLYTEIENHGKRTAEAPKNYCDPEKTKMSESIKYPLKTGNHNASGIEKSYVHTDAQNIGFQKHKFCASGNTINVQQEAQKKGANYINNNYTENSYNPSVYQGNTMPANSLQERQTGFIKQMEIVEYIKDKTEYVAMYNQAEPEDRELLQEIMFIVEDVIYSQRPYIRVNGADMPKEIIVSRFMHLTQAHMEEALWKLKNSTTDVKNINGYILTVLYNTISGLNTSINIKVQHDMVENMWEA